MDVNRGYPHDSGNLHIGFDLLRKMTLMSSLVAAHQHPAGVSCRNIHWKCGGTIPGWFLKSEGTPKSYIYRCPYAPCMVYLPTFGWFLGQMLVNIPYMEHMGWIFYSKPAKWGIPIYGTPLCASSWFLAFPVDFPFGKMPNSRSVAGINSGGSGGFCGFVRWSGTVQCWWRIMIFVDYNCQKPNMASKIMTDAILLSLSKKQDHIFFRSILRPH